VFILRERKGQDGAVVVVSKGEGRARTGRKPFSMDDLGLDNLRLAYERTTLAWVRTSLALIGFGFTIDKFFEAESRKAGAAQYWQPHLIGITMIAFGLISLVLFLYELREFRKRYPQVPWSFAGLMAALIGVLGIMALVSAILG
jgi:uncharacterized membrane protein YidH (DUF202 family)